MQVYSLFIIFVISTVLGDTNNKKKEIDMKHIKFDDIKLTKSGNDSIFSMKICNKYTENYYFYKTFIPKFNVSTIWGFEVFQDDKEIPYDGMYKKIKMQKFPNGYIAIEPNKCLPIQVKLNKYFEFDQNKEITIKYSMSLKCPSLSKDKGEINFTTTLLAE